MLPGSRVPGIALLVLGLALGLSGGCALFTTRPVQEMSDTAAAIRAAREVQAESLAPELFRQASENYQKARREYKFKNFKEAKQLTESARRYAEQAEFEAIRGGGSRAEAAGEPSEAVPTPAGTSYPYPTPTGTPVEAFDQKPQGMTPAPSPGPESPVPVPVPSPF